MEVVKGRKRRVRKLGIVEAIRTVRMAKMEKTRADGESFSLINWLLGEKKEVL